MTTTDPSLTVAEVLDKLAAHGSTRQIATHLKQQQCLGVRQTSSYCPVANWVRRETGEQITIGPSTWGLSWAPRDAIDDEGQTPDVVGDFISEFDDGDYPELDMHRTPVVPAPQVEVGA